MTWETYITNESLDFNILNENLNFTWSLNLDLKWVETLTTRDHLEIFTIKDNSFYINQDTFSYLFILILVWVLLMKSLIKISQFFFNIWFSITTWKKQK